MARNYAALPHEYLREMSVLDDAEFGRLCRALLKYSMSGTPVTLCGDGRFYAERVMAQEDRFQQSYEAASTQKSRAGRAGAARRWRGNGEAAPEDAAFLEEDVPSECTNLAESFTENGSAISANGKNGNTETETKTETKTDSSPAIAGRRKSESGTPGPAVRALRPYELEAIEKRFLRGMATGTDFEAYRSHFRGSG